MALDSLFPLLSLGHTANGFFTSWWPLLCCHRDNVVVCSCLHRRRLGFPWLLQVMSSRQSTQNCPHCLLCTLASFFMSPTYIQILSLLLFSNFWHVPMGFYVFISLFIFYNGSFISFIFIQSQSSSASLTDCNWWFCALWETPTWKPCGWVEQVSTYGGGLMQRALGSARPRDSFAFYKPYSKIICPLVLKAHFTSPTAKCL